MKEHIKKALVAESVPVWLTVIFIILGSVGTYVFTPFINQHQEAQRIRTEFIIKNLEEISNRTRSLLAVTSIVHQKLIHAKPISDDDFSRAYNVIAEMQWDIISLSIIFTDDDTRKLISEFQQASFEVQVSFEELQSSVPGDAAGIDAIVKRDSAYAGNVMLFALRLSMRIAELGGVKSPQPDLSPLPIAPR